MDLYAIEIILKKLCRQSRLPIGKTLSELWEFYKVDFNWKVVLSLSFIVL